MIDIKVKKIIPEAILPTQGSAAAAGYDLYATSVSGTERTGQGGFVIRPHETVKVGTGIALEIPEGFFGAVFARSGLATKQGLRPANCVGVIDSDYRGQLIVALHNDTNEAQIVYLKDRIAQLVILPYLSFNLITVTDLNSTERGSGGFGSTGQ